MRGYLWLATVAAFVAMGAWGYIQHQRAGLLYVKVEAIEGQRDAALSTLKIERSNAAKLARISDARQRQINKLTIQSAQQQKALNEALKANREWADSVVPDSVWDAITGSPADAEPARSGLDTGDT